MSHERELGSAVSRWLGFRVAYLGLSDRGELVFRVIGDEKVLAVARERLHEAGYAYGSYPLAEGGKACGWCRIPVESSPPCHNTSSER